MQEIPQFMQK